MSTTFTTTTTYYSSGSLAGLDSVVFHYDNSLSTSTRMNCNISSILLSALEAQRESASPKFESAAYDINAPSKTVQPTKVPSKRPRALDLSRPNAKASSKRPAVTSTGSPSSSTPVRPPTPHALFLFSPQATSPSNESLPPHLDSAPTLSLPTFSGESDPDTSPIHSPAASEQSHDIVVLTHHNSPYVPWPSPLRRQYLPTPTVSPASTQYSRSYSRSGAVAPAPGADREKERRGSTMKNAFKKLGQKIRAVTKQISMCPKRRKSAPTSPPVIPSPTSFLAKPSPLRRRSVQSTDSAMTTSLDTWLAERTQSYEKPGRNDKVQTLEEYDRCGSWIHVVQEHPEDSASANANAMVAADSLLSGLSLRTSNSYVFPETPSMAGLSPWSPAFQRGCQVRSPLRAGF
ncbi:hypothetical protein BDV98DRAFT_588927 [Pterulicium gracile]|uniref:Uncharacterized protein n=1 Tax=Pterulicium gracile TaxID=1884261 RepID=A0A5C3QXR6_9AGAR|nr:hypothetical protein BDV98DRAFT_588927 [Pterula gracilis]